ncbi:hypothetical protein B0H13DRAFT_1855373 [Mycena leptocephala]|nr:hypothetical protein B0H13DRAFT_1855373 [Mycena leptocephala]
MFGRIWQSPYKFGHSWLTPFVLLPSSSRLFCHLPPLSLLEARPGCHCLQQCLLGPSPSPGWWLLKPGGQGHAWAGLILLFDSLSTDISCFLSTSLRSCSLACFHVLCVVLLWFASPQCKMRIALWGCKPQKYYIYNFGGYRN